MKINKFIITMFICLSLLLSASCAPEEITPKNEAPDSELTDYISNSLEDAQKADKTTNSLTSSKESEQDPNTSKDTSVKDDPVSNEVYVSENGITYVNNILIANKTYALPYNYNPGVDPEAKTALENMIESAKEENIYLYCISDYRSYDRQNTIYNNYVGKSGQEQADRYSARPGHSEHQTGLAFDLNSLEQSFAYTPEGVWLADNCHKYGFILRYPADKEEITGYMYEPWHVRYVGYPISSQIFESGLCLEEYLGITSEYSY